MINPRFFNLLILSNVASIVIFGFCTLFIDVKAFVNLLFISLLFFSVYTVALYLITKLLIRSGGGGQFIQLVLYNVLIKIVFCFLLIYVYVMQTQPESKFFIVPFLISYFVFTVFETYFMNIQAKM